MNAQRSIEILNVLANQRKIEDLDIFVELFQVSKRTIQNDIKDITKYLENVFNITLVKKNPNKFILEGSEEEIIIFQNSLWQKTVSEDKTLITRHHKIIKLLLIDKQTISYNELSNIFFVSKSTIASDIKNIRNYFDIEENCLLKNNQEGTYFAGNEIELQEILKKFILDKSGNNLKISYTRMLNQLKFFFNEEIVLNVKNILENFFNKLKKEINPQNINYIYSSFIILIGRKKQGYIVKFNNYKNFNYEKLKNMQTYVFTLEISELLEKKFNILINQNEKYFINKILIAGGIEPVKNIEDINNSYLNLINKAIIKMSVSIGIDLTDDEKLKDGLLTHIIPLVYRIKNNINIKNPLLSMIKKKYSVMYGLTWFVMMDLEKNFHINLSEDEVGFIMIHFQAAIERKEHLIQVLFICPNGYGTSSLLASQVKQLLPNIKSYEVLSLNQIDKKNLENFDFIISTIPLDINIKEMIIVSPILTKRDIKKILDEYGNWFINYKYKKNVNKIESKNLEKFIDINDIYVDCKFSSKEEIIDFLCNNLEKENAVSNEFRKSVHDRESLATTDISNGVAIPHGNPNDVMVSKIKILVNKNKILWGNEMVDVVILLAINKNNVENIEPILEKIFIMIDDREAVKENFIGLSEYKVYKKII